MSCSHQADSQPPKKESDKFHGVDRAKINWRPTVDESKCIGCGMCVTTCGREVYKFDHEKRKAIVANPTRCMVACQTCANLCPTEAITFAENNAAREKAQKIVSKFGLLSKVKKELKTKKKK